jgi:uncharacterized protein with GYD domain
MVTGTYVGEGVKGLLREGGSSRRAAVQKAVEGLGGKLEVFYYAFGDFDVFGIAEMPDNVTAAAFSLMVNSTGTVNVKTTVLLTPEEVDQVAKKVVDYRAPGQ